MSTLSLQRETATRQKILDAATQCVANVGLRRTTLTDVAKAAGLSRMTIYRHYGSVEEILQDLMTSEFNSLIHDAIAFDPEDSAREVTRKEIVTSAIDALDKLTSHPLFVRLLAADPELLLPYMTQRPGRFQQHAEEILTAALAAGKSSGAVRRDDPSRMAASMILAMRGFAFVDKSNWSSRRRSQTLNDLAIMFDSLLAPESER
ncbi:MAG: TetR/AcrR family transcriptional regulator [Thermoleophilaceae bacterium]|nr:TetR/AcrR family transcriptional regulator [Thermoleophilaceae bacterium]